jgi:hypothetical protein
MKMLLNHPFLVVVESSHAKEKMVRNGSFLDPRLDTCVTPPKLVLANLVESLAIHLVEPTCGQIGECPYKTVRVNARKVNKSESTTIHQVRTWSY